MFFDFPEIVIIFGVALVVLGPKKLPKTAAQIGRWVGRARAMARQFREQLEQEVNSVESALDTQAPREPTIRRPAPPPAATSSHLQTSPSAGPNPDPGPHAEPAPQDFEASLAATGVGWPPGNTYEEPAAQPLELSQAEALRRIGRAAPAAAPQPPAEPSAAPPGSPQDHH